LTKIIRVRRFDYPKDGIYPSHDRGVCTGKFLMAAEQSQEQSSAAVTCQRLDVDDLHASGEELPIVCLGMPKDSQRLQV